MTKIELRDGYFVEVDDMNATLKKKYIGKTKKGEEKEAEKTIGYYPTVIDAVERFVVLNRVDKMEGMELSLSEYLNALKKADTDVVEFLQELKQKGNMELANVKPCRNMRCRHYEDDYCTLREDGEKCADEV